MSDDNFGPWIDWAGGPCPIPDAKAGDFEIKLRNGKTIGWGSAEYWATWEDWWQWQGPKPKAIVAYRVRLPAEDLLRQAIEALRELTVACVEDFGDGEDYGDGDEPVGGGRKEDGTPDPMAVTFGHIRKARAVLTAYDKRGK